MSDRICPKVNRTTGRRFDSLFKHSRSWRCGTGVGQVSALVVLQPIGLSLRLPRPPFRLAVIGENVRPVSTVLAVRTCAHHLAAGLPLTPWLPFPADGQTCFSNST